MVEINLTLVIITFITVAAVASDNIPGCTGVIKSKVPIRYSEIEIKLLTAEKNFKDSVECAPNGYFFIPIYDHGNYIIAATSRGNWNFSPKTVSFVYDGATDICTKQNDIIFNFEGFNLYGQVEHIYGSGGGGDVTIKLISSMPTEQKEILSVVTKRDGKFKLSPVLTGDYILEASHPKWMLSTSSLKIKITDDNYYLPQGSLVIVGYDVRGMVFSNQEPISQVNFILFAPENSKIDLIGCNKNHLAGFQIDKNLKGLRQLCHVASSSDGSFVFPSVPNGSYTLIPFYNTSIKFEVHPRVYKLVVNDGSVIIKEPFQVTGFSITGRIMTNNDSGRPVIGAKVKIGTSEVIEVNSDGVFVFDGIKSGTYKLIIEADDMLFDQNVIKVSPSNAVLPDIYPSSFKVCGQIKTLSNFNIIVKFETDSTVLTTGVESSGEFCKYLPRGNYTVSIESNDSKGKPLWFSPSQLNINVVDDTIYNVGFTQLKAELTGEIECEEDECDNVNMDIRSLDNDDIGYHLIAKNKRYKFSDLSAGYYDVSIENVDSWCWESTTQRVFISEVHTKMPPFKQTGTLISISSSHNSQLKYTKLSTASKPIQEGILEVEEGSKQYCLPGGSIYKLEPVGCHQYDKYVFDWHRTREPLKLISVSHLLSVLIVSDIVVDDLYVNVYDKQSLKYRLGPLIAHSQNKDKKYLYKAEFQTLEKEKLTLTAESTLLLFTPTSLNVVGPTDCIEWDKHFIAKQGIRYRGIVDPPLANVNISVMNQFGEVVNSTFTDNNGTYRFNPLHFDETYKLVASKEGYILSGPTEDGNFKSKMLGKITVSVKCDKTPLQSVLLSLFGKDNFRKTIQSKEDGNATFISLSTGEYYLRPMLKEYKFTPSHKDLSIIEGEVTYVEFNATRVLFSVFGTVSSLNRIPEEGVIMEAISTQDNFCMELKEEATSDISGKYRIRGLQPRCEYNIHIKKNVSANRDIFRCIPDYVNVQINSSDILDVKFTTIPKRTSCDVSLHVIFNQEFISIEFYRTLQIKLYNEYNTLISTIRLADWKLSKYKLHSAIIPLPELPFNGKSYYVEANLKLHQDTYVYSPYIVHFSTNKSYQLLVMTITPRLKLIENEIRSSYLSAVLIIVFSLCSWYRDYVAYVIQGIPYSSIAVPEILSRFVEKLKPKEEVNNFEEFEPGLTAVKRKIRNRKT